MKTIFTLFVLCACGMSCVAQNSDFSVEQLDADFSEAWVCHNPPSPQHGELCRESTDPTHGDYETCYWLLDDEGVSLGYKNNSSFCWLLKKTDCQGSLEYGWQKDNCHYFQ